MLVILLMFQAVLALKDSERLAFSLTFSNKGYRFEEEIGSGVDE